MSEEVSAKVVYGTKSEGLAAVLSFLWVGLGQIYCGRIGRGLLMMVIQAILVGITFLSFGVLFFIPVIFAIWNIYDAYKLAKKYNAALMSSGKPPW